MLSSIPFSMRVSVLSFQQIENYLRRHAAGLLVLSALAVPGVAAGATLAAGVLESRIAAWSAAFSGGYAVLNAVASLAAGLLPAVLFGTTMLVCSFSVLCLPLWGGAVLLYWTVQGVAFGILAGMCRAGAAVAGHMTVLPGILLTLPIYLLLALQPLGRIRSPGDPFGFDDVAGEVLSTVIPAMAAAALQTACTTFGCMLLLRIAT